MIRLPLAILLAGLASAATAHPRELGLVTQNNIAAMAVDLDPQWAGVPIEGGSGRLGADAVIRYRNGRVKPLIPLSGKSDLGQVNAGAAGGGSAPPAGTTPN